MRKLNKTDLTKLAFKLAEEWADSCADTDPEGSKERFEWISLRDQFRDYRKKRWSPHIEKTAFVVTGKSLQQIIKEVGWR